MTDQRTLSWSVGIAGLLVVASCGSSVKTTGHAELESRPAATNTAGRRGAPNERCTWSEQGDVPYSRMLLCECGDTDCQIPTTQTCKASTSCETKGLCAFDGRTCVASAEGCRDALVCNGYGKCSVVGPACGAASLEDCTTSAWCREHGRCAPLNGSCGATSVRDCQESTWCRERGRCSLGSAGCAAVSASDCDTSCRLFGACHLANGECNARGPEDCRKSTLCPDCVARDGYCVPP